MAELQKTSTAVPESVGEPLPIWFFVGVILLVYGVLVVAGGFLPADRTTVLGETRPSLWWGGIMVVAGGIFTAIGLAARGKA